MGAPRVAVVVVTYNSADVLSTVPGVDAPRGAEGVELTDVMVVDNASDDDYHRDREGVRRAAGLGRPADRERRVRRGSQRRASTALGSRPPDAVMVLNPDCRLRPRLARDPRRGAAGARAAASSRRCWSTRTGACSRPCAGAHRSRVCSPSRSWAGASRTGSGWVSWSSPTGRTSGRGPRRGLTGAALLIVLAAPGAGRAVGRDLPPLQRGDRVPAAGGRPRLVDVVRADGGDRAQGRRSPTPAQAWPHC